MKGWILLPLEDPVLIFTILIMVMLMAPILAGRLRVPDLILLLLAGAMLGPNGTGVLDRNAAVTMFGSVGLLYIMFLAGLELDLHQFSQTRQRSVLFGLLTFAIPQGLGMLAGRYILGFNWTTSILLASMFASHTLLAYPLASRLGISRTEPVSITVGATILTDTLALLVLAVIADSARGVHLGLEFWSGIGAGMIMLTVLTWWGIPVLARWCHGDQRRPISFRACYGLRLLLSVPFRKDGTHNWRFPGRCRLQPPDSRTQRIDEPGALRWKYLVHSLLPHLGGHARRSGGAHRNAA
jgi:Kef-type K+ transport system membrane component KefB